MQSRLLRRTLLFFLFWLVSVLLFRETITELVSLAWIDDRYTHIIVVPALSFGLLLLYGKEIFRNVRYHPWAGVPLIALGSVVYFAVRICSDSLGEYGHLTAAAAAIVVAWLGGFLLFYGPRCAKAALFPLSFLILAVPLPPAVVAQVQAFLQRSSAEVAHILFKITGTPVFRDGLTFSLPGLNIEVAQECSGIRSSIALLITALLLDYLFLRSHWRRLILVLVTVPIAVFKNAFRITTLAWLGAFVSKDYIHGSLHHRGGPLFSLISLALLFPVLWLLWRGDRNHS